MLNPSLHWGWHNWEWIRSQSSEWMWVGCCSSGIPPPSLPGHPICCLHNSCVTLGQSLSSIAALVMSLAVFRWLRKGTGHGKNRSENRPETQKAAVQRYLKLLCNVLPEIHPSLPQQRSLGLFPLLCPELRRNIFPSTKDETSKCPCPLDKIKKLSTFV